MSFIPLKKKTGHIFLELEKENSILLSRAKLLKLYREYAHPPNDKLLKLIHLAIPNDVSSEAEEILEDISSTTETANTMVNHLFF